jgi:hypothetical protein
MAFAGRRSVGELGVQAPHQPAVARRVAVHRALALQQAAGNQAVGALLRQIQRQASVSSPGDAMEHEAEAVADHVMRMADPPAGATHASAPSIQRMCAGCEKEMHQDVHRSGSGDDVAPEHADMAVQVASRGGNPLPQSALRFFEPRFGSDLSHVRVHADGSAAQAARSVNARAYTVGSDIVFGSGEYSPDTHAGKHLLAHELTHVVQQQGPVARQPMSPEDEKDKMAHGG